MTVTAVPFRPSSEASGSRAQRLMRLLLVFCAALVLCDIARRKPNVPDRPWHIAPVATAQTEQITHQKDAADDPAVWIHPTNPAASLILGTDKQGGLNAYSLDGKLLQAISEEFHPNNVDILYDFPLGSRRVDLAVASTRAPGLEGVKFWAIDRDSGFLSELAPGVSFRCFNGGIPYGLCCYQSQTNGRSYVFVNSKSGAIEQYLLANNSGQPEPTVNCVHRFAVSSQPEGCVADVEHGLLYVGEENVGIWCFAAEPNASSTGRLIARVGDHGLAANIEGLTIYYGREGRGYLIASSQGSDTFFIYERTGRHRLVAIVDPAATAQIDDVSETDGIDVVGCPLDGRFPAGIFVVQDGYSESGYQNFKLFDWRDLAQDKLITDRAPDPRRSSSSTRF